jgi:transcriptional regulator with XRE-family HTH domain
MTAPQMPLHEAVLTARRRQGLTQSELASRVGSSQSAISMFEAGRADALSQEKIVLIARELGLDLSVLAAAPEAGPAAPEILKFCPVDDCPSNVPYVSRGRLGYHPALVEGPASERTRCRYCGELLESACPNEECRLPVAEGACCRGCGTAYVTATRTPRGPLARWVDEQRARIRELRALVEHRRREHGSEEPGAR